MDGFRSYLQPSKYFGTENGANSTRESDVYSAIMDSVEVLGHLSNNLDMLRLVSILNIV